MASGTPCHTAVAPGASPHLGPGVPPTAPPGGLAVPSSYWVGGLIWAQTCLGGGLPDRQADRRTEGNRHTSSTPGLLKGLPQGPGPAAVAVWAVVCPCQPAQQGRSQGHAVCPTRWDQWWSSGRGSPHTHGMFYPCQKLWAWASGDRFAPRPANARQGQPGTQGLGL